MLVYLSMFYFCSALYTSLFRQVAQTDNKTTKINHSVNASESRGISNQELNINCSHTNDTTFLIVGMYVEC